MINIIKMDFGSQKYNFIWMPLFYLFFASIFTNISYIGTVVTFSAYMIVLGAISTEEANRIHLLHKSLPVTVRDIVGAKYSESLLLWILAVILCPLMSIAAAYVRKIFGLEYYAFELNEFIVSAVYAFIVLMIMISVSIPMMYKCEFLRSRLIFNVMWYVITFAIPAMVHRLDIFEVIMPVEMLLLILTAVAVIITILSFNLSVRVYGK